MQPWRSHPPFIIALVFTFCSCSAYAQAIDQRLQLALSTSLVSYESHSLAASGTETSATQTAFGPTSSAMGFGFNLGYAFTDNWLLGIQLLGNSTTSTVDTPGARDATLKTYAALPRVEYVFASGGVFRPYLGLTLGVRGSSSASTNAKSASNEFAVGGVAGLRMFALDGFSVDPGVMLLGTTGGGDIGSSSFDRSGVAFVFGLAFSGWPSMARTSPESSSQAARTDERGAGHVATGDDGTVLGEFVIEGQGKLRLFGKPAQNGTGVLLSLLDASEQSSGIASCRDVRVVVDGVESHVNGAVRPVPGVTSALEVLISPRVVEAIGKAPHSAALTACGARWDLPTRTRNAVRKFVDRFRDIAQRYGKWNPEAVPGADP